MHINELKDILDLLDGKKRQNSSCQRQARQGYERVLNINNDQDVMSEEEAVNR